jgi:hypothetical protein
VSFISQSRKRNYFLGAAYEGRKLKEEKTYTACMNGIYSIPDEGPYFQLLETLIFCGCTPSMANVG